MTTYQLTQVGVEVWAAFSPSEQVSQVGVEVWTASYGPLTAQFSQVGVEFWRSNASVGTQMVTTQIGVEAWAITNFMQVTQVGIEVWAAFSPTEQVSQVGAEVWMTSYGTNKEQISQVGVEVWVPGSVSVRVRPVLFTIT